MQPRILLPLAALGLVFAAPAAANAAVAPAVNGNQLTLTGDDTAETITLNVNADGLITHNLTVAGGIADNTDFDAGGGNPVTLPNDGTVIVTANLAGGNDTVTLNVPNLESATVAGGAGDDIITGTDGNDTISGEAGNDRITGFRGNDTITGGDGSDVMIWNNGDNNDTNDGGANNDETLITGAAADDIMTVVQNGTTTQFDRTNLVPFNVQMLNGSVEKLSLTPLAGNDSLATNADVPIAMAVDGGSGDDTLTTGAGADLLTGFDGNDTLSGQGGGDRIVGDRGNDTMNGGAGDDTTVWNNGDNNDVMNGDDGVDRVETNLAAAGDQASLKMENGRLRFDRLNLVPFNLSISAEVFELNGLGGDDSLTTTADVVTPLVIDAGAGNDTIQGGSASDSIDGGDGNDTISVRENVADFVRGGVGADTATVDAVDAVAADVETVDRPKPGAGQAAKTGTVKKGVASLKVSCPAGVSECKGSVTLRTAKGRIKTLGKANYTLKAGQSKTLKLRLAKNTAKLAKNKKLTVNARITSGAGAAKTAKVKLSFR